MVARCSRQLGSHHLMVLHHATGHAGALAVNLGRSCTLSPSVSLLHFIFFFQAEDGIRDLYVTGVQTCALPILGNNVGLLIFSPDGKNVAGPFFDPAVRALGYHGTYPSNATALRSGAVVALSYGTRETPSGLEGDLGIIRASSLPEPSLAYTIISHTIIGKDCLNFDEGSLAYDVKRNRLFVAYVEGCKDTRIMLTSSEDEGKTWTKSVAVTGPHNSDRKIAYTSLIVSSGNTLGLLWEEG